MHDNGKQARANSAGGKGFEKRRGSVHNRSSVRYLDLSFEGQTSPQTNQPVILNNGFRPHGGYRGTKKYPPSIYSFNKSSDQLSKEYEEEEHISRPNSPAWALEVNRESNHSGESPLFIHKLLSPSRLNKKSVSLSQSPKRKSRPASAVQFYRPNRTHQYLSATDLKDCTSAEVDTGLGRPTRTTLLRARQRTTSAPSNAYQVRRELIKKLDEKVEQRQPITPSYSMQDMLASTLPMGESLHSYLTGARYNRAHCLDAKSMLEHGVYMPRNNPLGCFIMKKNLAQESDLPDTPADSLASLVEGVDEESKAYPSSSVSSMRLNCTSPMPLPTHSPAPPPQPPSSPRPSPRRSAWEDQTQVNVDILPEEESTRDEIPFVNEESQEMMNGDTPGEGAELEEAGGEGAELEEEDEQKTEEVKVKQGASQEDELKPGIDEVGDRAGKEMEGTKKRDPVAVMEQEMEGTKKRDPVAVMEHILNLEGSLNIKGTGMPGSNYRPKSAKQTTTSRGVTYPVRPQSAFMLPSVVIQGKSINKTSLASKLTDPISKQKMAVPQKDNAPVKVKVVETADKSVNAPSVEGEIHDSDKTVDAEEVNKEGKGEDARETIVPVAGDAGSDDEEEEEEGWPDVMDERDIDNSHRPASARSKKVRFAVGVKPVDKVLFFMTEDRDAVCDSGDHQGAAVTVVPTPGDELDNEEFKEDNLDSDEEEGPQVTDGNQ